MRQLYAKLDDAGARSAPVPVSSYQEAEKLNQQGYGIFWSVNRFKGKRRIENLVLLESWFVEIDAGRLDKAQQLALIKRSPLIPSFVVESKNGYHVYFDARGPTSIENHRRIGQGLSEAFSGDPKATLITQLARVPGFLHWKDKDDPFMVKEIMKAEITFTEKAMLHHFPATAHVKGRGRPPTEKREPLKLEAQGIGLSEKLSNLDHEVALSILSGKSCVNFETYEFDSKPSGRKNIIINGKGTSCFISEDKKIGAKPGGPTLWQWLKYYGHDDREIAIILKEELGL